MWRGTVLVQEEKKHTVMLGAAATPCLYHGDKRVELSSFPFTIGRQGADYIISRNIISRSHAKLTCEDGAYYAEDLNSSNHTWVNGTKLAPYTPVQLHSGDRLRLGDEELVFHEEG